MTPPETESLARSNRTFTSWCLCVCVIRRRRASAAYLYECLLSISTRQTKCVRTALDAMHMDSQMQPLSVRASNVAFSRQSSRACATAEPVQ